MSKVTYESYITEVIQRLNVDMRIANRLMIEDIHAKSRPKTPMADTIQLRSNVTKGEIDGKSSYISWNVPYASYQNRGKRYDGTHVVKHYTTRGTGKKFADNAVKEVLKNAQKYYDKLF